jgi:transposase-like protein
VPEVARQHGICTSLVYRWRRMAHPQAGAGLPLRLLPVRVAEAGAVKAAATRPPEPRRPGSIEIERGGIRISAPPCRNSSPPRC